SIIRSSLQYHFLVITFALVLVIVGVSAIGRTPVDVLPEFSPPFVEIQTEALGLSAEEVEQMITVPLEQDLLAGVAWLDVIRSKSVPGLSSVVIYFEPGTDINRARQMVSERLAQAAVGIPHVSKPPAMIQPSSSASRFIVVGLSSEDLSLIEMSVLARWTIGPRLLGVPGVSNLAIWGNRDQQLQVLVDPEHLRDMGVTLNQIVRTTGNSLWVSPLSFLEASTPGTGGFIETPNQRIGVWHVLPISSPEDLAQVPVDRTALTLGDLTEIVEDHQPLIGDAINNDSPNLLLVIEKLPGTNILDVTDGVEEALAALRPGFSSIDFDATVFRPASFIETMIANFSQAMIIAAILLMLALGFFFYGWRVALISLISIPISLIIAFYVLHLQGATLNSMVLAGMVIALGIIIDDAVVDVEHILQRLRNNRQEDNPKPAHVVILEASSEIRGRLFFATLIIVLTTLPIFFLQGVPGALFQPLVLSYLVALLAAMVVALTVTPVLSLWLLADANPDKNESLLGSWLRNGYERILASVARAPGMGYLIVVILVAAGLVVIPFFGREQLIPSFQEPYLTIRMDGAPSTSRLEMNRIVTRASRELRELPGVDNVVAHVGRAVTGDQIVGINSAELWVSIDPGVDYDATLNAIQETVNGYPGLNREVQTYLQQILGQEQSTADGTYTLRVYGNDYHVLRSEVEKVRQIISTLEGVVNSQAVLPAEEPTIEIQVNLSAAQRFGVKPGDVRRAAAVLLSGLQVGNLFEEQKVFDVVVWSKPELRQSITDIQNLLIDTPGGGHVRLSEVAEVRIAPIPVVVNREAISPYLDVVFEIQGRNANAVLSDVKNAMQDYSFPLEYHAELKNDYQTQQSVWDGILLSGIIALIGIFLLLQSVSASWRMAFAAFFTLLAMLGGGLLAAFLTGTTMSIFPLFGLLAVLGIGARNSVLLIRRYHLLEQEGQAFDLNLVLRGSTERLVPTVLTTLSTVLALLPFVIFGNSAGYEVVRPVSLVILGGLMITTLLNLFVLPAFYLRFGEVREAALGLDQMTVAASES
ncbi:MAG TPA: efflux RND transporter permease subunit, partial [Anaerolineales bacterium]|nr:efflux RND transporter permease subunit [Anaerolineales bacterium]